MKFPVVDAFLIERGSGKIGVCCNTLSPDSVEVESDDVAVIGRLVVNRDGAERMIINSLVHPQIEYLILFGEESASFCPSTNLLLAIMDGYEDGRIKGGRGLAALYPNISVELLEKFKENVIVLPMFLNKDTKDVVGKYLDWLKGKVGDEIYSKLVEINSKKKIYFDSLNEMVGLIEKVPAKKIKEFALDPKEFQHLQPPIIVLEGDDEIQDVKFKVVRVDDGILLNIYIGEWVYSLKGNDSFLMAYSLNEFLNKKKVKLNVVDCLLIGTELSRIEVEIRSGIKSEGFVQSNLSEGEVIPLLKETDLKADKEYYYKVGLKDDKVYVQSLANDNSKEAYEYRCDKLWPLVQKIAEDSRFEDYEQKTLHCIDVGIEMARACIALNNGMNYFQDFRNLFKVNKDKLPLLIVKGNNFLGTHQKIITELYTKGLTMTHPDNHKGTMRSGCVLAVYRNSDKVFDVMPDVYASDNQSTSEMRRLYREQLLSADCAGTYTYGERTRKYFGKDQLVEAVRVLKEKKVFVVQRFDFNEDMGVKEVDGNLKFTKDPCLTHDIYFVLGGKLHSLHIARAHNIVNAYPENLFGLHDSYDSFVAKELGVELGDLFMLSNRANILLLTEEQKTRKFIAEVSKQMKDLESPVGPNKEFGKGISYGEFVMEEVFEVEHSDLERLENYNGEDIIARAIKYLKLKGNCHNNPILGTYDPRKGSCGRLLFFQANERGGKLFASAVFLGKGEKDKELCDYIATKYKKELGVELGDVFMFHIGVEND